MKGALSTLNGEETGYFPQVLAKFARRGGVRGEVKWNRFSGRGVSGWSLPSRERWLKCQPGAGRVAPLLQRTGAFGAEWSL